MFREYLQQNNFTKRLAVLSKKFKNKRILIYGAGLLFKYISENHNLSNLNIIGISDRKYLSEDSGNVFGGYNIIPYDSLMSTEFDYILLTVKEGESLKKYLSKMIEPRKIVPLFKQSIFSKILNKFKPKKESNTAVLIKQNGKKIYNPKIKNLNIHFWGSNNYIEIHEPYRIRDVKIACGNKNKLVILGNNRHTKANIILEKQNTLSIGTNTTMTDVKLWFSGATGTNITIGKDCMFSYGIEFRTGDGHSIYDIHSKQLLNHHQDIEIKNHVWIGRNSLILKNTKLASNTIVGANSLVNKKFEEENCIIAGNPAKIIKREVNWDRRPTDFFDSTLLR